MAGTKFNIAVLAVCLAAAVAPSASASSPDFGPLPPQNPATGPNGLSTMHGDSASSDATPSRGPGSTISMPSTTLLGEACPTVLQGADGIPQALCTRIIDRSPVAHLLDPATGHSVASLTLAKGALLGGVYAYLDQHDQMVMVDGNGDLLRIAHDRGGAAATPRLTIAGRQPLDPVISAHCGKPHCDSVTSLMPDFAGRVWFATGAAVTGTADPATGAVKIAALPAGERVSNSISTAPGGTAVATTHALYLLTADGSGTPRIVWRQPYDRGPAQKPGQLSWGTGATPTFFGPRKGTEYLTITDNAVPQEHLLVYDAASARRVCSVPIFRPGASGTENSPIGAGNSVFVASTYGYPYPATPDDAGPSDPPSAPFSGGMTRLDVRPDGSGCDVKWANQVRSAAVPRLASDGMIYTATRTSPTGGDDTGPFDRFDYAVIDPETGRLAATKTFGVGISSDTLQMVGTIAPNRILYQGTLSGIVRIAAGS